MGFEAYRNESSETWKTFLKGLKKRGLCGVMMSSRNISGKAPKKYQAGLRSELQEMFACKTMAAARARRDQIIADYKDVADEAVRCLDDGFESAMTVMTLPVGMRRFFRTSNHIERLNKELKRRSKVIGIFPNEDSLIRLIGSVLIEQNSICQIRKAIFSKDAYQAMLGSDVRRNLHLIAEEQVGLPAA